MDLANKEGALHVGTGDLSRDRARLVDLRRRPHLDVQRERGRAQDARARAGGLGGRRTRRPGRGATCCTDVLTRPSRRSWCRRPPTARIAQHTEEHGRPVRAPRLLPVLPPPPGRGPGARRCSWPDHAFAGRYDAATAAALAARVRHALLRRASSSARCAPDGPKVGSVSLSPRGDWRMPSDASVRAFLDELDRG